MLVERDGAQGMLRAEYAAAAATVMAAVEECKWAETGRGVAEGRGWIWLFERVRKQWILKRISNGWKGGGIVIDSGGFRVIVGQKRIRLGKRRISKVSIAQRTSEKGKSA
jgi:hypothetical protein